MQKFMVECRQYNF